MNSYRRCAARSRRTPARRREERRVNPWLSLAQGVVLQAIADWRTLESGARVSGSPKTTVDSLRAFFRSQWADDLLLCTDISASYVLDILERERTNAEREHTPAARRKRGRPVGACCAHTGRAASIRELKRFTEKDYL